MGNKTFTTPEPFAIDKNMEVKLFFYLDGTKQHGLIAAKKDAPTSNAMYILKIFNYWCNKSEIGMTI